MASRVFLLNPGSLATSSKLLKLPPCVRYWIILSASCSVSPKVDFKSALLAVFRLILTESDGAPAAATSSAVAVAPAGALAAVAAAAGTLAPAAEAAAVPAPALGGKFLLKY